MTRCDMDIYQEILQCAIPGKNQISITCQIKLNHGSFQRYIPAMIERGLLSVDKRVYYTTEKGKEYIKNILKLKELVGNRVKSMDNELIRV